MLSVRGLRKSFAAQRAGGQRAEQQRVAALDGVDLEVAEGTFASVLGASGSGKTTLLRCIAGFVEPDAGTITLAGRELGSPSVRSVRPHARGVGIVPQEGALFPHLSVDQNIAFALVGRSRAEKRSRVAELLELVGMEGLGARRPHELSGGQQQRVALARALAPKPKLVLLDEPFSALDAKLRVELREEVREMLRIVGSTVVLVTHDQAEAMAMADHLAVMRNGRVVAAGTPREVYDRPVDLELARFLGTTTVFAGRVVAAGADACVECALGRLAVHAWDGTTGACEVLIRPEDLRAEPALADPNATAAGSGTGVGAGAVVGSVRGLSYFGADALAHVALPGLSEYVSVRVPGNARLQPGDQVSLVVTRPVSTYPRAN
jgi:iron(III) transport system ATP-binding protein